jgi:hypothetical protein
MIASLLNDLPKNFAIMQLESQNVTLCAEHADLQESIILFCIPCSKPVCS